MPYFISAVVGDKTLDGLCAICTSKKSLVCCRDEDDEVDDDGEDTASPPPTCDSGVDGARPPALVFFAERLAGVVVGVIRRFRFLGGGVFKTDTSL